MTYLIIQTFILLLIAAVLGLLFGWYMTRIAAASARSALRARLLAAEDDARALRAELDATMLAKRSCDTERRLLSDELSDMRARQDAAEATADSSPALAMLQAELDQCRSALASAGAASPGEPAPKSLRAEPARLLPEQTDDESAADDLQQIKGIGPKIAAILEQLGIRQFSQIAAWSAADVERINDHLQFKGRIEREEWVAQAKALLAAQ